VNPFKKKEATKEVAIVQPKELAVTDEIINQYMKTFGVGKDLMPHELEAFKLRARTAQLNPILGEIHCSAYGKKNSDYRTLVVVTDYKVYIRKAEMSGRMDYWLYEESEPGTPLTDWWARVRIKRTDRAKEQTHTVYYKEIVQPKSPTWMKSPRFMTKKVAISQGFRLFFAEYLGVMPYTDAEMDHIPERNVTPDPVALPKETKKTAEAPQTVEAAEAPVRDQRHFDDKTIPEEAEVVAEEPEIPDINYFSEIIALVNKSSLPSMAVGDCKKGKMEYIREAKEHINDQNLLKSLFEDLVRDANG